MSEFQFIKLTRSHPGHCLAAKINRNQTLLFKNYKFF
jgi:hypothetical protein